MGKYDYDKPANNTNLIYNLAPDTANEGNIMETFFLNQLRVHHHVVSSSVSDFMIDDLTFEVGGKNKGQKQIKNTTNAFLEKDDSSRAF